MWRAAVQTLLPRAETAEAKNVKDIDLPAELKRRVERWHKIAEVKAEIERRAQARYAQKPDERAAQEPARGQKAGREAAPGTDPGSPAQRSGQFHRRRLADHAECGRGGEPAYNAQATVDMATGLVVGAHVTQHAHDQQEVAPALEELTKRPKDLGQVKRAALDHGYDSENHVEALVGHGIKPFIALGRQSHDEALEERLAPVPEAPKNADAVGAMKHRPKTVEG